MRPQEFIRQVATYYPDSDSIKRVLEYSSVDTLHIDTDGKPLNTWFEAFKETFRQGRLPDLIQTVSSEYPALHLDHESLQALSNFLSRKNLQNGTLPDNANWLKWILTGTALIGFAIVAFVFFNSHKDKIVFVLHAPGNRELHPLSLGILKLQDTSAVDNFIQYNIGSNGIVKIEDPPDWLKTGKVRLDLQGVDNDSMTYSLSSRVYSLAGNDTIWAEVSSVPKKREPPLDSYEFVRLKYNSRDFDFLSNKSSLQLKKYIISDIDNKPNLFADRHVLRYLGDELENEKILSAVNWTENRDLQLEYKLVPLAVERHVEITIDNIDLGDALVFFGGEVAKVSSSSPRGSKVILPKMVGTYPLEIFYKDNRVSFPIQTGYSDMSKYFTREEFLKHSQKIRKVVN